MKHLYLLRQTCKAFPALTLVLSSFCVQGQITLTQASYAGWAFGLDSVRSISAVTVTPSNNASWDLTGGTYGSTVSSFTRTAVSGNSTFPSATYSVPATYSFNSQLAYQSTKMRGLVAAGLMDYGQVIARQAIGLKTLTGGANDSLVFNQQNIVNTSPEKVLSFPLTAGTAWSSSYGWDLSFNLTVAAYMLNNAPGVKKATNIALDSVKGWGKMRLKRVDGTNTGYMDVLGIRVSLQQKDSFFLNGAPAPAPLVAAFGLTQGQLTSDYYMSYYRAGEAQPLLSIFYTDNTYSTPTTMTVHAARLAQATAVGPVLKPADGIKAYPNPVSDGLLNIEITDPTGGNYTYELISATGQKVSQGPLNTQKGNTTLHLDQASGIYYLRVADNKQSIGLEKIQIGQ